MSTDLERLEEACESIDAGVFSGDLLWHKAQHDMLEMYVGRWSRAIADHRKAAAEEAAEEARERRPMTLEESDRELDADSYEIDGMGS